MFASRSTLLLSLVAAASTALAFQQQAGPACTTAPGTACQYSYTGFDDNNGDLFTVVDGFCGPVRADGISYCADAGARCEIDDNCYQFCGTTPNAQGFKTCAGVGARCYDRGDNAHDGLLLTCREPSSVCSVDCGGEGYDSTCQAGVCLSAASQGAGLRKVRRSHRNIAAEARALSLKRAAAIVARPGDEILS